MIRALIIALLILGANPTRAIAQDLAAEIAAPYLGLYWVAPEQKPMIVVLENDRLALEIPWQGLITLRKAEEANVWSVVEAPAMSLKFHREGDGPVTALDVRQGNPMTLARFVPDAGLPGLEELFKRRPDQQRATKLAALGAIRMSGTAELSVGDIKGSFELLTADDDHSRLELNLNGGQSRQVVAGSRAWAKYQPSMAAQELPEAMANATRLSGWLLSTGDWRDEFKQTQVLKRVELDGEHAFIVHAAPERGRQRLIYLDAKTALTRGYDEVYEVPGMGMIGCSVRFTDYRDIDGVQIPFKSTVKWANPALGTQNYQVEKIETRVKLDKDPFVLE